METIAYALFAKERAHKDFEVLRGIPMPQHITESAFRLPTGKTDHDLKKMTSMNCAWFIYHS